MTNGIHHITAITRRVQANVDFYVGFLGLRLVKRTAGFEDATQLHLFYGDAIASPGSLLTFLVWEDGSPGRVGHGAPNEIGLAVPRDAIGFWLTRALQFGIAASGPSQEFGEPVLRLHDPDGMIVKLVGITEAHGASVWSANGIPSDVAVRGLRNATILSEKPQETIGFLVDTFGWSVGPTEGTQTRMLSGSSSVIDIRDASGFWTAAPGTGTIDHIALRATDRPAVEAAVRTLEDAHRTEVNAHDRTYFYSLYVREPGGSLIEFATDGPGFLIDEDLETLGAALFIPPHFIKDETDVRAMLPQFGLPGEPRTIYRELPFVHRINVADADDASSIVLLHGTGGNEASLLPFGRSLSAHATLIGVRGRSTEEGSARFFRRFADGGFDRQDIVNEAAAFAATIDGARSAYGLDTEVTTFVGYSNGANFLSSVMMLHPGIVKRAILLRPMAVLADPPLLPSPSSQVLIIAGRNDTLSKDTATIETMLTECSMSVTTEIIDAGHELAAADMALAKRWLALTGA